MTNSPQVTVVIVTWNNENDIAACLDSLRKTNYPNFKTIIVDNASSDKTVEIVRNNYPEVNLLPRDKNYFLTGSNNYGINYAFENFNPEYILVLNPDTKVEENIIAAFINVMNKDKKIGAVGPKIKFWNNSSEGLINSAGLLYDGFMQAYDRGFAEEDKGQYDSEEEVFGVSGACIMYRTEMLAEIGLYWDVIKMYLDEVEMFIRAKKAGWKVVYTPLTTLWHSYMKSTDNNKLFNQERQKMKAWLFISLRHYTFKQKVAMLSKYFDFRVSGFFRFHNRSE